MPPKITRVRWSASSIPWGVSFNEETGIFSGTPDDAGEYIVPVTVETNYGKDTKDVIISVAEKVHWEKVQVIADNNGLILSADTPVLYKSYNSSLITRRYSPNGGYYSYYGGQNFTNWSTLTYNSSKDIEYSDSNTYLYNIYGVVQISLNLYYFLGKNAYSKIIVVVNGKRNFITPPYTTIDWRAGVYSSANNAILFISKNGVAVKLKSPTASSPINCDEQYSSIGYGTETNPNCAAWSTVVKKYCVSATGNIVATSSDGDTWELGSAPDNLLELEFRSDLGKFFARGENTKLFYVSEDGLNWTQYNSMPIPLSTVKSVAYSSAYGYCAVGLSNDGAFNYSAHSADLENWTFKKIDTENIELTNVVYAGGSINSFVAAPKSGGNFLYRLKGTKAL